MKVNVAILTWLTLFVGLGAGQTAQAQESYHDTQVTGNISSISGKVVDSATRRAVKASEISLVSIKSGFQIISTLKGDRSTFNFKPPASAQLPLLVRAKYQNVYFSVVMTRPDEELQIPVRTTSALPASAPLYPVIRVTRQDGGLLVTKLFIIKNESSTIAWRSTDLSMFIPAAARDVIGVLEVESMGVSFPVEVKRKGEGYFVEHALLPGQNVIYLEFVIRGHTFEDRLLWSQKKSDQSAPHNFVMLLWRPLEVEPTVSGAQTYDYKADKDGRALQVAYPTDGGQVSYDFSQNSFGGLSAASASRGEERLNTAYDYNPIFDHPLKSLLGLLVFLGLALAASRFIGQNSK